MRNGFVVVVSAAVAILGLSQFRHMGGPPDPLKLTATQKAECGLSAAVTEGPFYVSGTGALRDGELNSARLPGVAMAISGHVYEGASGTKPLAGAVIEIWQADSSGNYHPNANGDVAKFKPQDVALRGFVQTDAEGAYHFSSIYPGEYTGRTRHVHFRISAPGKSLTTQLIIPSLSGDSLGFDDDTIAQGLPDCALLKFDDKVPQTAHFDFRL